MLRLGVLAVRVEGELVAPDRAEGLGAAYVQRLRRAGCSEGLGLLGHRVFEVEGIGEVELALDADGAVEGDVFGVDVEVPAARLPSRPFGGQVGHEPGDGFLDEPLHGRDADLVRERRDLAVDERDGFGGEAEGVFGDPPGPPDLEVDRRDLGPGLGQAVLQLDRVGDQARPESVDLPIASANSAMQNSATSGAPCPASGRPVSPPAAIQVAASSMDSGGCCSAQVTAARNSSVWARSVACWRERA